MSGKCVTWFVPCCQTPPNGSTAVWRGIGFHHPAAGYVCAVFPAADHVRVGFEHGHLLPDPGVVFDPGGKQVRYIAIHDWNSDLAGQVAELVEHAVHLRDR